MRVFIFIPALVVSILSMSAFAEEVSYSEKPLRSWYGQLFLFNVEMRTERDSSQQIVERRPLNFAVGVRKEASQWLLEYSAFSEKSGNNTLLIDRRLQTYSLWWKEDILQEGVGVFIGVGLGAYESKVITKLSGAKEVRDSSRPQELAGLSAGIQGTLADFILLSLEGRALFGKNFDPNPQGSLIGRLGVEF